MEFLRSPEAVAVALFLLAQALIAVRNWGRQTAVTESLAESVQAFTEDTKKRFETQDSIIRGHTEQLTKHTGRIAHVEGRLFGAGRGETRVKTEYDELIQAACLKYLPGLDWRVHKAQLWQESRLNPRAVSPAGAGGIAQFMEATWAEVSQKAGFVDASRWDPESAIPCSAFYMAQLWQKWKPPRPVIDRYCLALASYNAGLGSLLKAQKAAGGKLLYGQIIKGLPSVTGDHSRETIDYVRLVMRFYADQVVGDA